MAFKTGKTLTVTASGTTTGSVNGVPDTVGGGAILLPDGAVGQIGWSFGIAGASAAFSMTFQPNQPTLATKPFLVNGGVTASGLTSASDNFPVDYHGPGSSSGHLMTAPINLTGSWALSVDCEEWIDIVFDDQTVNADVGIYQPIQTCRVVVFLKTKPGGTISASAACADLSTSVSGTIVSSGSVTPAFNASGSASQPGVPGSFLYNGTYALGSSWISSLILPSCGGTVSNSSVHSTASATISQSSFSLSASLGGLPNYSDSSYTAPAQCFVLISASLSTAPLKTYSMVGQIFSVGSSYPGSVPINFSKYAGDPSPTLTGAGFGAGYGQRQYSFNANAQSTTVETRSGGTTTTGTGHPAVSGTKNEFQGIGASVQSAWCDTNDEFVTYINALGGQVKLYNNAIYLHGYSMGAIGLSLQSSFNVDPGNSLTGWTGATLGGAGIGNTGTGAMTRSYTPFFDMSGYRWLKITGAITTSGTPQNRVVTINGKTWNITFPIVSGDIYLDLCNPTTGGADDDTTDSIWPDPNPTLAYGSDSGTSVSASSGDGPLWGCTYVTSLQLSGFAGGSTESFASLDLVKKDESHVHAMCNWEPRFDSMIIQGPDWSVPAGGGGDTVFTRGVTRALIATSDGRQSLEYRTFSLLRTEGGASGLTFYGPTNYSIDAMAFSINNGVQIDGGPVGSDANYFNYAVKPNGWQATVVAPPSDGSNNVNAGFLNKNLPATWVCYGAQYSSSGFTSSVSAFNGSAQMLMSSLDFYPGCGDVFGLGGGGADPHTIYVGASKIYRAQVHGILMTRGVNTVPAPGSTATLYPGPGEVQPTGASVGSATSDSPESVYRCVGDGLDGFDSTTIGLTTTVVDATGTVTAASGTGAPQSVNQTFAEAKLSRVAFRLPQANATFVRPDNLGHENGSFHRVAGLYDMSGNPNGIAYWRRDQGQPYLPGSWDVAAIPISISTEDRNPSIAFDYQGRLFCNWERLTGIFQAFSDDDGLTWSTPILNVPNGLYPVIRRGTDGSLYRVAYVDDGTGHNSGTLQGQWQAVGDPSPSATFTLKKNVAGSMVAFSVQQGSYMIAHLYDMASQWILTVLEVGATAPTEYVSADDLGGTFVATGT